MAIDPAPFRGVLPLPFSALKSSWPVLGNPVNLNRAIPLTFDQFRFGFTNAVSEKEAEELYEQLAVPASGAPLFQAAVANLNPWTEAKVDIKNPERGPLLILSGEKDNTVLLVPRCAMVHSGVFLGHADRRETCPSEREPLSGHRPPRQVAREVEPHER